MDALEPCTLHPTSPAGWTCAACDRTLCPVCAAVGLRGLPVCARCGEVAQPILVPRALVQPFETVWAASLRTMRAPRGWGQITLAAVVTQSLLSAGPKVWALGRVFEFGWLLDLARRAGVGFDPFGLPRYSDLASVWLGPMVRLFAGAGLVLAGGAWLSGWGSRPVGGFELLPWTLVVLSLVLVPVSVVVATIEGEGRSVPWPWTLPGWFQRLGRDLLPLHGAVLVIALMELLNGTLPLFSMEDTKLDLHILQAFLPRWLSFFGLAALGTLAGTLVRTRATELGHGDLSEDRVPALEDAPRGRWEPPPPDPRAQEEARARRFAPIELGDPEQAIREALARGDPGAVLESLQAGQLSIDALAPAVIIQLAQLVAGKGDVATAAKMLRAVVERPADEQTPRALVILARLCVERLGTVDEGHTLYRRVLAEFPGTSAAAFAASQVPPSEL